MVQTMVDHILIVDDEADVADLLSFTLKNEGFNVSTAGDGEQALKKIRQNPPSLVVLDLMLPGVSGTDVCRTIRRDPQLTNIPIVMLTAKSEETDRIVGFELGADDYIIKPFSPRELVLRVRAVLRRGHSDVKSKSAILKAGALLVDTERYQVTIKGKPIELTSTEFKLLALFMERKGRVQNRDKLLQDVWNYEASIDTRTVDTHIRRLREKLGPQGEMIETVRGVGYRFADNPS